MMRRWHRWLWTWSVLNTVWVCAGFLVLGPAPVVIPGVGSAALIWAAVMGANAVEDGSRPKSTCREALPLACYTGTAVITVAVVADLCAWLLLILFVAAVLSSPPVLTLMARGLRPAGDQNETLAPLRTGLSRVIETEVVSESVSTLTNVQLCVAWRRSYRALQEASLTSVKNGIVHQRQIYLDELEARDAVGLQAWLTSGPRAAGGPDRYLLHAAPPRPDPDRP